MTRNRHPLSLLNPWFWMMVFYGLIILGSGAAVVWYYGDLNMGAMAVIAAPASKRLPPEIGK